MVAVGGEAGEMTHAFGGPFYVGARMTTSIFGSVVHRVEDPRFLRGEARYTETLAPDDALRAVFVRSIIAHGAINAIDAAEARVDARRRRGPDRAPTSDSRRVRPRATSRGSSDRCSRPTASGTWGSRSRSSSPRPFLQGVDAAETCSSTSTRTRRWSASTPPLPRARRCVRGCWNERRARVRGAVGRRRVRRRGRRVRARVVNQRLAAVPMETNGMAAVPRTAAR